MRQAFLRNRRDIIAPLLLAVLAVGVLAYILLHIPTFHPPGFVRPEDRNRFVFKAQFSTVPSIVAGRAQTVNIAGVTVGDVRGVKLEDGRAVVTMSIRRKYAPIYRDATILLRPRTPLKDMYLSLDPGTRSAGALRSGATLPVSQTAPDVNYDEILGNLDADTRSYLVVLLSAAGQALRDPSSAAAGAGTPSRRAVDDLRADYRRFVPLAHNSRRLFTALARRRTSLRRLVHDYELVSRRIGGVDDDLAGLIDTSNRTFRATSSRDTQLRAALAELPSALQATDAALGRTKLLAQRSGPTFRALQPFARNLGPALRATQPDLRETTPILRDRLRPFARRIQPVASALKPAAQNLAAVLPDLRGTLTVVNRLFNALAYNPPGPEEGFLFWAAWLVHDGPSLLTAQDAQGATPRALLLTTCSQLDAIHQVELGNPSLGPVLRLLGLADRIKYCPNETAR